MNWFWMNVPLMVVFFAAMTGIPLWLSLRHPDTGPMTLAASSPADEVTIDEVTIVTAVLPEPVLVGAL
jgi:hypothetical protein